MRPLIMRLVVEVVVAVAVGGALLAVCVPLLIRHHFMAAGDPRGGLVIGGVLALAIGITLCRPGSALRRRG